MDLKDPDEFREQCAIVNLVRKWGYLVFAIPNGFQSDARTKAKFKKEGLVPGFPDIGICGPDGSVIWLEMKTRNKGTLSKSQKEIHSELRSLGHIVLVGYGAKDALQKLRPYLDAV